jgi:hypothetical protein
VKCCARTETSGLFFGRCPPNVICRLFFRRLRLATQLVSDPTTAYSTRSRILVVNHGARWPLACSIAAQPVRTAIAGKKCLAVGVLPLGMPATKIGPLPAHRQPPFFGSRAPTRHVPGDSAETRSSVAMRVGPGTPRLQPYRRGCGSRPAPPARGAIFRAACAGGADEFGMGTLHSFSPHDSSLPFCRRVT